MCGAIYSVFITAVKFSFSSMRIARHFHFSVLDSTNSYLLRELEAARTASEPFALPTLVTADIQTAGRGQKERIWHSPEGCLKFTLAFRPDERGITLERTPLLGFASALAICRTAERHLKKAGITQTFAIHWPNDIYWKSFDGKNEEHFRKFAGILLEGHSSGVMLAGIGINLLNSFRDAPDNLREILISMKDLIPDWQERAAPRIPSAIKNYESRPVMKIFLEELLEELDFQFDRLSWEPLRVIQETDSRCSQKGTFVTLQTPAGPVSGFCSGLAHDGGMILNGKVFRSGIIH